MIKLAPDRSLVEIVNDALSTIRDYYDSDYVYYIKMDDKGIYDIYEWCQEGAPWRRDKVKALKPAKYPEWLQHEVSDITKDSYSVFLELEDGEAGEATAVLAAVGVHRGNCNMVLLDAMLPILTETIQLSKANIQQEFFSFHDPMTNLNNFVSYREFIDELGHQRLRSLGILSVNINGLKRFNEEFGRAYGDEVVIRVGSILKECFKKDSVFRYSGDEFLVVSCNSLYATFMESIHEATNQLEYISLGLVSMGHCWERTNINPDEVAAKAEDMMRSEKQKHAARSKSGRHVPILKNDLLEDIRNNKYIIVLSPKMDVYSERIIGAEAQVRYHHSDMGVLNPTRYLSLLEDTKLSHYLDMYILEEVCKALSRWEREGLALVPVAVNFQASTLNQQDIGERIKELLDRYHVSPEYIEIEISETDDDLNQEMFAEMAGKIRKANVRVILDHFGAKHSTFSILSILEFDSLKLDPSVVSTIVANQRSQVMAQALVGICRQLGNNIAADGVETKDQLYMLRELGIDYAQGSFFNTPIVMDVFEKRYLRDL